MVKLRLSRIGRKNLPAYRIVVSNANEKRDSRFLEEIGHYSPITKTFEIKVERAKYWLSVGAQPTDTVRGLLVKKEVIGSLNKKKIFEAKPKKKSQERIAKKANSNSKESK